ncbi:MAG: hypothetical protein ACTSWR_11545 [Candidatus Helarchaeota archaeon]
MLDGCVITLNARLKSVWDDRHRSGIFLNIYQDKYKSYEVCKKKLEKLDNTKLEGFYLAFINRYFRIFDNNGNEITDKIYGKTNLKVLSEDQRKALDAKRFERYVKFLDDDYFEILEKIDKIEDGNFLNGLATYIMSSKKINDPIHERSILDKIADRLTQIITNSPLKINVEEDKE